MPKEVRIMCKKLNELCGLTPAKILESCDYDITKRYAVDIRFILKKLGVPVYDYDFSLLCKEKTEQVENKIIDGAIVLKEDDLFVFSNSKYSECEKRFVLAHELAHCCLHASALKDKKIAYSESSEFGLGSKKDPKENQADEFAAELLIPEQSIRLVYQNLKSKNVTVLAEIFSVSVEVMCYRLSQLQLSF